MNTQFIVIREDKVLQQESYWATEDAAVKEAEKLAALDGIGRVILEVKYQVSAMKKFVVATTKVS